MGKYIRSIVDTDALLKDLDRATYMSEGRVVLAANSETIKAIEKHENGFNTTLRHDCIAKYHGLILYTDNTMHFGDVDIFTEVLTDN